MHERRAVLDVAASLVLVLGLAAVLVLGDMGRRPVSLVAVVTGVAFVGAAGALVVRRRPRWSGPADRVTLGRTVLAGGCATVVVLALAGSVPARSWWLVVLAAPALLLDALDGVVARRTGTASEDGARLDMEVDAALLLVLSVAAAGPLGAWVLLVGGMRYAFVAASWWRPELCGPLPPSRARRVVAGLQGAALLVALVPVVPLGVARGVVAVALVLLSVSFGRDVRALQCGEMILR